MQRWLQKENEEIIKAKGELKERYMLMKRLSKVIVEGGGVIFGGYVRDTILHYIAAKKFYNNSILGWDREVVVDPYTDPFCDPDTFNDRNRVARDIDVFINEKSSESSKWTAIMSILCGTPIVPIKHEYTKELRSYCWHPGFKKHYNAFRYYFSYYYNSSLSKANFRKTIRFHIDVVFAVDIRYTNSLYAGPWQQIPDFNVNKILMDSSGIHAPPRFDYFEGVFDLEQTIADIRSRTAEFNCCEYWKIPDEENNYSYDEKYRWRAKIIHRFLLMHNRGFVIRNSPLQFHEWKDDDETKLFCNGEESCCISHDVFTHKTLLVKFRESKSPMTISSLVKLLDTPSMSFQDALLNWGLLCPVSKSITRI